MYGVMVLNLHAQTPVSVSSSLSRLCTFTRFILPRIIVAFNSMAIRIGLLARCGDEDLYQSFGLSQPGAYPRNGALTLSACYIYNLGSHSLIPALLTQASNRNDKMMERYYVYHRKNGGKNTGYGVGSYMVWRRTSICAKEEVGVSSQFLS